MSCVRGVTPWSRGTRRFVDAPSPGLRFASWQGIFGKDFCCSHLLISESAAAAANVSGASPLALLKATDKVIFDCLTDTDLMSSEPQNALCREKIGRREFQTHCVAFVAYCTWY